MNVLLPSECMNDIFGGLVGETVKMTGDPVDLLAFEVDGNACIIAADKTECECDGCLRGCVFAAEGPFDFVCLHYGDDGNCESESAKSNRICASVFGTKNKRGEFKEKPSKDGPNIE